MLDVVGLAMSKEVPKATLPKSVKVNERDIDISILSSRLVDQESGDDDEDCEWTRDYLYTQLASVLSSKDKGGSNSN